MATTVVTLNSEAWRDQYSARRYLEFLAADELEKRYLHLLENLLRFTTDGRPHLDDLALDTGLTRRTADVWAEAELRKLGLEWRESIENAVLQRPFPYVRRALEVWGNRECVAERTVIKYGRRENMVDLHERGILRLTPASAYSDPALNSAIRDSELEFGVYLPPGTRLQFEAEPGSKIFQDIPGISGPILHKRECPDYFMFCSSAAFEPRAFGDFGYDSCVVIHDWIKLFNLIKAMPVPARELSAGPVSYLDPYMPHRYAEVEFLKHLRFAYQKEWRIIWTNPIPSPPLQPFWLELGNLSSFCDLITL